MTLSREIVDEGERIPDKYFSLDHIVVRTPSIADSLKWAKEAGFTAREGGKHGDGLTENVLISLKDGSYIELISFVEPTPDVEGLKAHWWSSKIDGVIDWCLTGREQEAHLSSLGGEEAYAPPKEGGRKTKDGKDIRWVVTFPSAKPRGELPFTCNDLTPREWRVPPADEHPNGAIGIKSISLLAKPTRMVKLFNPLQAVLGRASAEPMGTSSDKTSLEFPPRNRVLRLSTHVEPHQACIDVLVRDAATEQEQEWIAKAGEGLYEVQVACERRQNLSDSLQGLAGLRLAPIK